MFWFVEALMKKKPLEAKGLMLRHNIQGWFEKKLSSVKYDEALDTGIVKTDKFGPISSPVENHIALPPNVQVHWISTDEDCHKLKAMLDDEFIGVDSEWRPCLSTFHSTKPSLLQLSGGRECFLVDLISLCESKALNDALTLVFTNPKSTIVGFGFSSDLSMFTKNLPVLTFIKLI